ncbi:hypothetical protein ACLIBH_01875 [Virgibacillus sp. W0430]|uniref:hypothetical protein n=1 Tax=Virgibacillus sp. W0430 TaxID=3391580 RepID=UPI003F479891
MDFGKQVLSLAFVEVRQYSSNVLLLIGFLSLFLLFIITSMPSYLSDMHSAAAIDVYFIIFFGLGARIAQPKEFQRQKSHVDTWVSPYLIALQQLAISKQLITKARLLASLMISIPYNFLLLLILYITVPELRVLLSPLGYAAFSILWICTSVIFSSWHRKLEAGSNFILQVLFFVFIFAPILYGGLQFFHEENGLVYLTMIASEQHPLSVIILSIVVSLGASIYLLRLKEKKMNAQDYL